MANTLAPVLCCSGVSFDAEHTLVTYAGTLSDAEHYDRAFGLYCRTINTTCGLTIETLACPSAKNAKFPNAWEAAMRNWAAAETGVKKQDMVEAESNCVWTRSPFAGADRTKVHQFYRDVVCNYFDWITTDAHQDQSVRSAEIDSFVAFLCDVYYSANVYQLPSAGVSGLTRLRSTFPHLPLCVVSNCDDRIVAAVRQFDVYAEVFPVESFVCASSAEYLKPHPWGLLEAMRRCGVVSDSDRRRWLHVGDSAHDDGGAAAAAGCLFLRCVKADGVDFCQVIDHVLALGRP